MLRFGSCLGFTVVCFILTIVRAAFCQWQQVGLESRQVNGIAFSPGNADTAYAAVYPSSIAIEGENGEVMLIGTYSDGIYRRTCSLAGLRSVPNGAISIEVLPNPASRTSSISFTLPTHSLATLKIYDIRGRLVKKLLSEEVSPGYHSATWDTRDQSGTLVSPGIYYLELETATERIVKPVVVVR